MCKATRAARRASTWASPARPHRLVTGLIRAYRERYPGVILLPEQSNTTRLVLGLRRGEIDLAFVRPPIIDAEGLLVDHLVDEPMVIALARGGARWSALPNLSIPVRNFVTLAKRHMLQNE